ncbi:MAG: Eco29kI family restriction endonuclease [Verrucomicrobiae bacterium]|nr:Eco29kI family restriction endonuclease [Verrucomicrobiae bacterium]
MQAAVEAFMIGLFKPIWNKEIKVCYGIGKHGDDAKTRANKRSPWDTMHPGRAWATATKEDQKERGEIVEKIGTHFAENPPIKDRDALLDHLALR